MNNYQDLWWQQAKSDYAAFVLLRNAGIAQCHSLHYLQMVTEKIAKAYFWRANKVPPKNHTGFTRFLRLLGQIQPKSQKQFASLFEYKSYKTFQIEICNVYLPIAYELEHLAPALANDGPNPEYPWPHKQPTESPVNYNFPVWAKLMSSADEHPLITMIGNAVKQFSAYVDI